MINSQIQILEQAETYLHKVTPEQYQQINTPLFMSSAGQHLRHILDHYLALISGTKLGVVDYDLRHRGGNVESDISVALNVIAEIKAFLNTLTSTLLQQPLLLSTEISIKEKRIEKVSTSLARELVFVSSHAIHHFAMIAQISKAQNVTIPEQFGIAPATATFMREQACAH